MKIRNALAFIGDIILVYSFAYIPPIFLAFYFSEPLNPFIIPLGISVLVGLILRSIGASKEIKVKEAFFVVSTSWLIIAFLGSLPYMITGTGSLSSPANAFFESMSGFTTTGASVLMNYEGYPKSIMFWRQFTQWIGGMGIVVLALAILPRLNVGGARLMKLEAPGPELEKLTPHIKRTAEIFWLIYTGLTFLEALALTILHVLGLAPLMTPYNALIHSLTTMSTGGFSPYPQSIGVFSSSVQWVITCFMILAGTNFALYWYMVRGDFRIVKNEEFKAYILLIGVASATVAFPLITKGMSPIIALRSSLFHVASILTTTGYTATDFNRWPLLARYVLFVLMFVGGCSGSTAGGIKVIRWLVALKAMSRELYLSLRPKAVRLIRLGGKIIDERDLRAALSFIALYLFVFAVSTLIISLEGIQGKPLDLVSSLTAVAATLGNIGPGLGLVGPTGSYAAFPALSKVLMALLMWLGRLELITALVLFTPFYWREG